MSIDNPHCSQFLNCHSQAIFSDISLIRKNNPLIHNITNYVAMPAIANMLLAIGASPLMAHARDELSDLSNITKALVLNIGTLDREWLHAMQYAQNLANQKSIPIILDPVGAGASQYRTQATLSLLSSGVTILRGNASEILALADQCVITKGVDANIDSLMAQHAAEYIAKRYSCVVVVSGTTDIIVNSQYNYYLDKSSFSFFTKTTAMGCAATGIIGAFAAVNKNYFTSALHAMATFGIAGEKAMQHSGGPGTFYVKLLDALYQLTKNDLEQYLNVTNQKLTTVTTKIALMTKYFSIVPSKKPNVDYSLYLIADCEVCNPDILPKIVEGVIVHGVTCVQLRGKKLTQQQLVKIGQKLLNILTPLKIPLIINDSIAVAKQLDAAGVHLGQNDFSIDFARKELGSNKIIGLSLENDEQAHCCANSDVDYFGVGPVFATTSKSNAAPSINIQGLRAIKSHICGKPIIAIGGINSNNVLSVLQCGVDGIATASAILNSEDPVAATKQLHQIVNSKRFYHCVLTIAGSDSSGGAGIQADIKTIAATGGYATSVITALTAQNTIGVSDIYDIPANFVGAQLDTIFEDINFSAVKIGMLHHTEIIEIVAAKLKAWKIKKIVLDPVMVAKSGDQLITDEALVVLKKALFPLAYLITPNICEAEILLQYSINSPEEMEHAAEELASIYHTNILIKGGHLAGEKCVDVLFCNHEKKIFWFSSSRVASKNTHGTGCTLSAAIASYLAQNNNLLDAVAKAKDYLTCTINAGSNYLVGRGHGPLYHFVNH